MTAQFSDILVNECESVDFSSLSLCAVLVGDVSNIQDVKPYVFSHKATRNKLNIFTACWRGYISKYKLNDTKTLKLVGFEYPALLPHVIEPDEVSELVSGDFWLDMRAEFFEGSIYIPFRNGKLVVDENEWTHPKLLSNSVK